MRDVGAGKLGGDLEAVDSSGVRRLIEVKGTTGTSVSMEVTKPKSTLPFSTVVYSLVVVRDIDVPAGGTPRATKGRLCVRPVGAKTVRTRRTEIPVATGDVTVGAALKHGEYPTSEMFTVAG